MGADVVTMLDALVGALQKVNETNLVAIERAEQIRDQLLRGAALRDVVEAERRPLIVEMIRGSLDDINEAGSRFRRAEARALHAAGLTMEEIGELFGVSRQRVSALINAADT